ncbi:hypothetical protein [Vagococcus carniphilus]|uniref:Uncharacterized protein n=1 Tax=Vagococcus carniphilus TaxID=218144 RepID=A0A430AUC4_9ENTE|nr:hypothetical protein [Vagococcus carniphilus]QNN71988.1 hypothetical protein H9L18_08795 [Vagococcus carniphilus]RSU11658.1 hypothetical protein CBF28_11900 [Vagococcus carniphilus]
MVKKNGQGKSKLVLRVVLAIYVVELLWFLYSQVIKKMMNGQVIDIQTKELAIMLTIGLLVILILFVLKKSRKIGGILMAVLVASVILFCVLAPLLDVYIPIVWQILKSFS